MSDSQIDPRKLGWHSRGYLPHFEAGPTPQFVTFHLSDSLPVERLTQLEGELKRVPENERGRKKRKAIEALLDEGHGQQWLRNPAVGKLVEGALLWFDARQYLLHSWVVMPNHVHVLFTPHALLSEIIGSWKSFTSKEAGKIIARRGSFWDLDYFDRVIRNERHFLVAMQYIEQNPVKARLCKAAEDWPWSSARRRLATERTRE